MAKTLHEALIEIAPTINWQGIDAIREALEHLPGFDLLDALGPEALKNYANVRIRKELRGFRDDTGQPVYANLEQATADGGIERVYKQEFLFDVADYVQLCQHQLDRADYFQREAGIYRRRAIARFGDAAAEQLPFIVDEAG